MREPGGAEVLKPHPPRCGPACLPPSGVQRATAGLLYGKNEGQGVGQEVLGHRVLPGEEMLPDVGGGAAVDREIEPLQEVPHQTRRRKPLQVDRIRSRVTVRRPVRRFGCFRNSARGPGGKIRAM